LKQGLKNGEDWRIATFYDKKLAEATCDYYNRVCNNLHQEQFSDKQEKEIHLMVRFIK
jgi:hypothetical protein